MLKLAGNAFLRRFTPATRGLMVSAKASFATDPFNNPYGSNQKTAQNIANEIKAG